MTDKDYSLINDSISSVDLESKRKQLVCHLSGGERSLAYLAMVLAKDCPYVFMDEPFASLDVIYRQKVSSLLNKMKEEGKCVFVSIHDLILALEIADEFVILEHGKLIGQVSKEEFIKKEYSKSVFQVELITTHDDNGREYLVSRPLDKEK